MPDAMVHTESPSANLAAVYKESSPILKRLTESRFTNLSELRRIAGKVAAEVKNKFRDQPEEVVEGVLDLSLGFLRLDQDTLVKEGIKPNVGQRELSARLQHTYADLVIRAGEGDDPALSATLYDVLKDWQSLKNQRVFAQGSLPILWRGTESEIAIIRALKKAGYEVRLPNYAQSDVSDSQNEVLQWDVKSGVDMIARRGGQVLLIDAKGRIDQAEAQAVQTYEIDPAFEPNQLVRETVLAMRPEKVIRTRVFVPSDTRSFVALPSRWPDNPDNPSEMLNNFGRLRPQLEVPLVDQLDRIDRVAQPINRNFA